MGTQALGFVLGQWGLSESSARRATSKTPVVARPVLLSDRPHWPGAWNGLRISWSKLSTHEMSCCRDTSIYLACSYSTKIRNSKACLIDRNKKKRGNSPWPYLPCYSALTHEDRKCFNYANAKIPEISVGFLRPEYSGSPLEVVQLFRSTKICWLFHFWQTGSSLLYFSSPM